MRFFLFVDQGGYVLKKDGEMWQAKFALLPCAIKHLEALPGSIGAKVVIHSADGSPRMELEIGT